MPTKISHKTFMKNFRKIHKNNLEVLNTYKLTRIPVRLKCNRCGWTGERTSNALTSKGLGCVVCDNKVPSHRQPMPVDVVLKRISDNTNYVLLEPFTDTGQPTQLKCSVCKYETYKRLRSLAKSPKGLGTKPYRSCCEYASCAPNGLKRQKKQVSLNGKPYTVEGYEPQALKYLTRVAKVKAKDIRVNRDKIPRVIFTYKKRSRSLP